MAWFVLLLCLLYPAQSARTVPLAPTGAAAPRGVRVELQTASGKTTFGLSEIIPLKIGYQSARPGTYTIELADGWNSVAQNDRFLIQPGNSVIDRTSPSAGITCCKSSRAYLRGTPAIYPVELTNFVRFTKPGEYRIQYATRRIFRGNARPGYEPSDLTVKSNVLTLTIVDDDPEWLRITLAQALEAVADPQVARQYERIWLQNEPPAPGSLRTRPLSERLTRYREAREKLRMLDTPEAIRERVARLRMPSTAEWRSYEATGNGYRGVEQPVAKSSRPDLVATALAERAALPEFGVMRGYFELWVLVVMERDHPELFLPLGEGDRPDWEKYGEWQQVAKRSVLDSLRAFNRAKVGIGAEITSATIRAVERDLANPSGRAIQ